jgi:hypothetical protein
MKDPFDDFSGEIRCADDSISYRSSSGDCSLPISAIRLIGEYTTSEGPCIDDYFFVFLTAPEGGWHQASFYAKGRDEALQLLGEKIGAPIEAGLCNSTEFKTRIIWPLRLKNQAMMDVLPPTKQNFWQKLIGERMIALSPAAREAFIN